MFFAFAFSVDKNVIKIHYYSNVKLLCQDLIDIALEWGRGIDQSKKHYLILEMAIASPESCFLFVAFSDPHLMIDISQIKLGETSSRN